MNTILNQNILSLLGLDGLPDDRKGALLEKMSELVQKRLALRLLDALSPEDGTTLEKMLETNTMDDPEVAQFFQSRVPNIQDMLQEEIVGLKEDLVGAVAA